MDFRTRTRGRPRVGDPDTISAIALGLMTRDGWAPTTMDGIAQASGISTPTLFRYFPSKASVLWHGMDENAERFRTEFTRRIQHPSSLDTIFDSYLAMLLSDPCRLRLIKARIAIMERDQDASAASWSKFEEWRRLVTGFVAIVRDESEDALEVRIQGAAMWSALSSALSAWALSADHDPAAYIETAQRCMIPSGRCE
ncbi:TetR/AcrR family transcriptional regulator [Agromyces sp. NPDC049794]|uniref:TetR/AcrR family transcriptional regulator n=1 Tax=unclassified Agromyces TaxID=2639701 RepID=UPI0033C4B272